MGRGEERKGCSGVGRSGMRVERDRVGSGKMVEREEGNQK